MPDPFSPAEIARHRAAADQAVTVRLNRAKHHEERVIELYGVEGARRRGVTWPAEIAVGGALRDAAVDPGPNDTRRPEWAGDQRLED